MKLAVVEQVREHHPGHVVVRARPDRAHLLHLSGMPWKDIATEVGYASGRVAAMAVTAWLQKIAVEQAPDHRRAALQLELDRLDRMQAAFWDMTLTGDYHAAEVVLKIIARRCKIMGFDKPNHEEAAPPRTVLITGNTEQYIEGIEAYMAGDIGSTSP